LPGSLDTAKAHSPKTAVVIDRLNRFFHEPPLGFVLFGFLAFHFQYKIQIIDQTYYKIGAVLPNDALPDVANFESNMIVFNPGHHAIVIIKVKGFTRFPCAVENTVIDVRFDCVFIGLAGILGIHVTG
jgi:hypothetical protein